MKSIKATLINIILISLVTFNLHAHEVRVTIHVVGEDGHPVAKAKVTAEFTVADPKGGLGNETPKNVEALTDTNGICVITGSGDAPSVGIAASKDGYYGSDGYGLEFEEPVLGKWQPWNPTVEVILQKKGVQVPMYARKISESKIPAEGKPVGFDLAVGDWVAPFGKGKTSDFLFQWNRKPEPPQPPREPRVFDVTLTISFSNVGDGIQRAAATGRGLRLQRQAPSEGYERTLSRRAYHEKGKPAHSDFREDQNYFFKVRANKDANGNIVSALYGKIQGDFNNEFIGGKLNFTYYLNPEPNSRNMEFDPKQNLAR